MTAQTNQATPAQASEEPALNTVNRLVTWGRMAWLVVALGSGGIGTGVGFLLGEGAARATFEATIKAHETRIESLEVKVDVATEKTGKILEKLNSVEGSLDTIKALLRNDR